MNADEGAIEFLHHFAKRHPQRCAAADQHIVASAAQTPGPCGGGQADDLAQAAANPVALDGIADLAGHREADPRGVILFPLLCLKHKGTAGGARATSRGSKIATAFQPLDDGRLAILLTH
jgi:hypothetical protein